ncbi:MAG: thiamine diphosphokinase [Eubacterium sp.]|nr:thiamine diphosphokinase [Eubacterium sp.]
MRVYIISGGTIDAETFRKYRGAFPPDAVIAADKGLEFCLREKITPDHIVGDFDSAKEGTLDSGRESAPEASIALYRPEKDMTDTDIAVEKAIAIGATEAVLFGATGTRLDHTMANIFDLCKFFERGITGIIVDAYNRITLMPERHFTIRRSEQYGGFVSFMPVRGPVKDVTFTGFKYSLSHAELFQGDGGLAVSNEIVAETAVVSYAEGILVMMETKD